MKTRSFKRIRAVLILLVSSVLLSTMVHCSINANNQEPRWQVTEWHVTKGDTLWNIGLNYCDENTDVRRWIHNVQALNNMPSSDIYEGDTIRIYIPQEGK